MTRAFKGLMYEARERQYWAEDDWRWGRHSTTLLGFWLLAFFGRIFYGRGYKGHDRRS